MTEAVTWVDIEHNAKTKRCSSCGAQLSCGRDLETCWCVDLPPLPSDQLDNAADCLCPICLDKALKSNNAR